MSFFKEFNFDTLLALISCIAGIIALFIGGTAYKNCSIKNKNDSTKKLNGGIDNSINITGDISSQGITEETLLSVVKDMRDMTNTSFSSSIDKAYKFFEKKCDENLHQIIDETNKIITDQKLSIAGYTKIDWIQVYFESAKNTSDIFMQQIWAKVLAKELASPNSFCYKTLDVLKNMSENEFKIFESLCAINISGIIVKGDYLNNCGLNWLNLQKLREYGLISLDGSQRQFSVVKNKPFSQTLNNQYLLLFFNKTENMIDNHFECFILTNAANELLSIVPATTDEQVAIMIASRIKESISNSCSVELHKINSFMNNGESINYQKEDLLQQFASDNEKGNL